ASTAPPPIITNLRLTKATANSFILLWNLESGPISSYVARINPGGKDVNVPAETVFNSVGPYSTDEFTLDSTVSPPFAAPNLFVAGAITSTSAKLTWQALPQTSTTVTGASLQDYLINYLVVGGTTTPINNIPPGDTTKVLDGLKPCSSYSAIIRGFSNQGSNQNGLFTTLPSTDTETLAVSSSSVTANQALIAVTETGPTRSTCGVYVFQYVVESSNGQSVATYKSPLNTQLVSNLQPDIR
ncbi:hypothetical protein Ciccas_014398, partial [Cichlidogyrus casuarinus]